MKNDVKILIVDDDNSIRQSLSAFLEDYDFVTTCVNSAENGLQLLQENSFDIALVDLRLPGLDGNMFIIKAHQIIPAMKFIILTGSVNYDLTEEIIKAGVSEQFVYLKPLPDLSIILKAINSLLTEE